LDKRHKDEHPEYKYRPRRRPKGVKRGYNSPTMMMSPTGTAVGKPYAIPTQWARVVHTAEGEAIASPRAEAPQIIYGADGTQYYAVPKASFAPTMATPVGGSVIVSPTQVAAPHQIANVAAAPASASTTATATTNYPAYVTVPIPATSTAIFHPVAIPVQGVHTPAFVLRPPYPGSTVYSPMLHPATTTTAVTGSSIPVAYQNIEHRAIEAQTRAAGVATKTESTNTIVKTPDGETIVIIQRPMEGAVPIQLKDATQATSNAVALQGHPGHPQIYQHHVVHQAHQPQEIKQILIEPSPTTPS